MRLIFLKRTPYRKPRRKVKRQEAQKAKDKNYEYYFRFLPRHKMTFYAFQNSKYILLATIQDEVYAFRN